MITHTMSCLVWFVPLAVNLGMFSLLYSCMSYIHCGIMGYSITLGWSLVSAEEELIKN